jgi:hypothetical protein
MGTEYLKRFDWGLAASIRAMGVVELARLLTERYASWSAGGRRPFSDAFRAAARGRRPFLEILLDLLAEGASVTELQNDAVYDLCLQGEDVQLGWDALAEALPEDPEDAVSSLDVLPGTDEEVFLLLRPQQLDAILQALRSRTPAPALREPATVEALCRLREACSKRPGQLVAYCFEA